MEARSAIGMSRHFPAWPLVRKQVHVQPPQGVKICKPIDTLSALASTESIYKNEWNNNIPSEAGKEITTLTAFLLTVALAAMGLETDVARLYAKGLRPAILGALAFLFIATFSLTLIKLAG